MSIEKKRLLCNPNPQCITRNLLNSKAFSTLEEDTKFKNHLKKTKRDIKEFVHTSLKLRLKGAFKVILQEVMDRFLNIERKILNHFWNGHNTRNLIADALLSCP